MSIRDDEISFRFVGRHDEGDHALLDDLIKQLGFFLQALNRTNGHLTNVPAATLRYQVIDLKHSSPAIISLKAIADANNPRAALALSEFYEAVREIQETGHVRQDFDREILETYKNVGIQLVKERFADLSVIYRQNELHIRKSLVRNIDVVLDADELEEEGSISGRLEEINVHAGTNAFRIYPPIGPNKVICHFPQSLMERAIEAVNKHVNVYGKLKYKPRDKYAQEITVSDLEIYPDDEELPNIVDLRGMAPNATGGVPSEEFIARLRLAWR